MRYYSHVINVPNREPFDSLQTRFFSWIGNFVKPLRDLGLHDKYWFSYYGDHVKYRVLIEEEKYGELRQEIDRLLPEYQLTLRPEETDLTLEDDLGCGRFLSGNRSEKKSQDRAYLVLSYLHSIAELIVDNLEIEDNWYWTLEQSTDLTQNPNGSNFESLHHLLCNMTQVRLSVLVTNLRTILQPQLAPGTLYGTFWGRNGPVRDRQWQGVDFSEVLLLY